MVKRYIIDANNNKKAPPFPSPHAHRYTVSSSCIYPLYFILIHRGDSGLVTQCKTLTNQQDKIDCMSLIRLRRYCTDDSEYDSNDSNDNRAAGLGPKD